LIGLHERSLLPGDSKDTHGEINSETDPLPLPSEVAYPFSRTFHVTLMGETFTNNYTVVRMAKHADWQLQRAWRTASDGHTIEEWPVK
jgi:hypothetical protein